MNKYKILFIISYLFCSTSLFGQYTISGKITTIDQKPLSNVQVIEQNTREKTATDDRGFYRLSNLSEGKHTLFIYKNEFAPVREKITIIKDTIINIELKAKNSLSAVEISQIKRRFFNLRRLDDIEGTSIYSGKKTEVVLADQIVGNTASNNARQIYAQITGLNIYEGTNCGLQLAIGGRGLDPNRTTNFNTRQNGYDISADVLGYPESYYTPPVEAVKEIEIIRGAGALQYGTQFGGLINFKMKQPATNKPLKILTRQSYNSICGYSTFNSLSGTKAKLSYYTYFNYRKNNKGYRANTSLDAKNFYAHIDYQINNKSRLSIETTYLHYLAQQPGGLTDAQFYKNPKFSNRSRNWFSVDWQLINLKFEHQFNYQTRFSLNAFGLNARRETVGFITNRVSQVDNMQAVRDLIKGKFRNWGVETRFLSHYRLLKKDMDFLVGAKYYQSYNSQLQGPGTKGSNPNFRLSTDESPDFPNQSDFSFPNLNLALLGENIIRLNKKLSVTPGFRLEYIKTESKGMFKKISLDLAGNTLKNVTINDNRAIERVKLLLGIGISYKPTGFSELYANITQNYRSVTFNDIRINNPSFKIDPNIKDESGFSSSAGIRGKYKNILSYDANAFALFYNGRIGEVLREETIQNASGQSSHTGRVVRYRGNIGQALTYGLESLIDWNVLHTFYPELRQIKTDLFVNLALTQSRYTRSSIPGVKGKKVEFVPQINLKTGLNLGYKNWLSAIQLTYLSKQYSDASNAPQNRSDNQSGVRGAIPAYSVVDASLSYRYKRYKIETGINNLLNKSYFTRRATGYPGPGIIPSLPRTFYATIEIKF